MFIDTLSYHTLTSSHLCFTRWDDDYYYYYDSITCYLFSYHSLTLCPFLPVCTNAHTDSSHLYLVFFYCKSAHIVSVSLPVSIPIALRMQKAQELPSRLMKFSLYIHSNLVFGQNHREPVERSKNNNNSNNKMPPGVGKK